MNAIEIINSQIGPLVTRQVALEQDEIPALTNRMHGAQHPESLGHYHQTIREKQSELDDVKAQVKNLRAQLIAEYEIKHAALEVEIANSFEAFDIEEMRTMQREIRLKIDQLKRTIAS